jgi:uncharacterized protein YeeX (DUF496 family)
MPITPHDIHNKLDPALVKIELLTRLSPLLPTDKEYAETLGLIIEMVSDYTSQMRRDLDKIMKEWQAWEADRT